MNLYSMVLLIGALGHSAHDVKCDKAFHQMDGMTFGGGDFVFDEAHCEWVSCFQDCVFHLEGTRMVGKCDPPKLPKVCTTPQPKLNKKKVKP